METMMNSFYIDVIKGEITADNIDQARELLKTAQEVAQDADATAQAMEDEINRYEEGLEDE